MVKQMSKLTELKQKNSNLDYHCVCDKANPFFIRRTIMKYTLGIDFVGASKATLLAQDKEIDLAASGIPVGSEGLVFHPYINGELAPYADPKLYGSLIGVRTNHTKAHFNRAVLEGVVMSMLDCKTALRLRESGAEKCEL